MLIELWEIVKNYEDMIEHTPFTIFYFPKKRTKVENSSVAKISACTWDSLAMFYILQALNRGRRRNSRRHREATRMRQEDTSLWLGGTFVITLWPRTCGWFPVCFSPRPLKVHLLTLNKDAQGSLECPNCFTWGLCKSVLKASLKDNI